jgi:tetratricopeptide (TPR) repeat protein
MEAAARRGEFAEARRLGSQLLQSCPEGGLEAAQAENLLGGVAFEEGKLDEAEARFEGVMRAARSLGDAHLAARAANNLASIAHLRGKETLATDLYRSALTVWEAIEALPGESQTCHNLAILLRESGQCAEAAHYADRAVRLARRSGDTALEALTLAGRAETALRAGNLVRARTDLRTARRLARRAGDGLGLAEVARLAGALALAEGRPGEALREARLGYRRARGLGGLQVATECADLAARACRMLKRLQLGRRYYRSAVEGYTALGAGPALKRLSAKWGA